MKIFNDNYIDGAWIRSSGSDVFELINPATEAAFGTIRLGTSEDVDRAVRAARLALPAFSVTSVKDRIELLGSIIQAIANRETDLADAVTTELGTPVANQHVKASIDAFKQAIAILRTYEFETRLGSNIIRREPIGVCGFITAWNWPVQLISTKLSAALAAGCTVVAKPSEFTPTSAIVLTEILHAAGLPAGVFNLVLGNGPIVGDAISRHPDIDMVSFTGSTRAGVLVAEAAAPTVKRVSQELGGKSAHIILPDADLRAAARFNISRGFSNAGQSCHAPTRVLVQEDQARDMLSFLVADAEKVKVGDPRDPATTMGPVANRMQFERVQKYIEAGAQEGARLACGGLGRPDGLSHGYFVRPTIFQDVDTDMTIAREEIFGPVLSVLTYKDEADAVEIANSTNYGLGGYVFTSDLERGLSVGRGIRAGRIFLNGAPSNTEAPMGGYKQSGNGREMGIFGLEEYLEVKAIIGFFEDGSA